MTVTVLIVHGRDSFHCVISAQQLALCSVNFNLIFGKVDRRVVYPTSSFFSRLYLMTCRRAPSQQTNNYLYRDHGGIFGYYHIHL